VHEEVGWGSAGFSVDYIATQAVRSLQMGEDANKNNSLLMEMLKSHCLCHCYQINFLNKKLTKNLHFLVLFFYINQILFFNYKRV